MDLVLAIEILPLTVIVRRVGCTIASWRWWERETVGKEEKSISIRTVSVVVIKQYTIDAMYERDRIQCLLVLL